MTVPNNMTFAEEVKADRLKALYRVTLVLGFIILLGLFTFGTMARDLNPAWFVAMAVLMLGAFATNRLLERFGYRVASWVFVLSTVASIGFMMYASLPQPNASDTAGTDTALQIIPFIYPIIIFIGGLLLSPLSAFGLTVISSIVVLVVPTIGTGATISPSESQFFAIVLMIMSAALAAQVTGELYQITQWALDNYRKERETNEELFERRRQLDLSLKRSEALGERLQETNADLEVAHREAEEAKHFRGQFLANMSHELRTPLNAIIGFSETMLQFPIMYDNEALPEPYERDLNQIYNSGRQLLHVINDILDLAKVDAGKLEIHMQSVETGAIANAVMSTAKGLLGSKPVRLDKKIPEEMPIAWADETRLRQVLLNLYSNACKYTDEGKITLLVDVDEDANEIQFAVKDTGTGIDEDFHDKLFQEFQQAKHGGRDPRSGSGLGLAITRQLLDLMGGRVWMESVSGEGSTFYFTVQLYNGQDKNGAATTIQTQASKPEGVE